MAEIALRGEDDLLDLAAEQIARSKNDVARIYGQCVDKSRQKLIAERGDPKPNRLG